MPFLLSLKKKVTYLFITFPNTHDILLLFCLITHSVRLSMWFPLFFFFNIYIITAQANGLHVNALRMSSHGTTQTEQIDVLERKVQNNVSSHELAFPSRPTINTRFSSSTWLPHETIPITLEERLHNLRRDKRDLIIDETSASLDYEKIINLVDQAFQAILNDSDLSIKEPAVQAAGKITAELLRNNLTDITDLILFRAPEEPEDVIVRRAYQAYLDNDPVLIQACKRSLPIQHPLINYLRLWHLQSLLQNAPRDPFLHLEFDRFIKNHIGSYLGEKAIVFYLLQTAHLQNNQSFHYYYNQLQWNKNQIRLLNWHYIHNIENSSISTTRITQAKRHYRDQRKRSTSYKKLGDLLSKFDSNWHWSRVLITLQKRQWNETARIFQKIPAPRRPFAHSLAEKILQDPQSWYYDHQTRLHTYPIRLRIFLCLRLAPQHPQLAAKILQQIDTKLKASLRATLWNYLGYIAITNLSKDATDWYQRADSVLMDARITVNADQILAWQARAALRAGQWYSLLNIIERMQEKTRNRETWLYWYARALRKRGRTKEAKAYYQKIASHFTFYGKLATDALQTKYPSIQTKVPTITEHEITRWEAFGNIQRAMALYRIQLYFEGHKEWNWGLKNFTPQEFIALAEFAKEKRLIHRMINTSLRSGSTYISLPQRYPQPQKKLVSKIAMGQNIPFEWIYGLIRQESRFIPQVQSAVGARGLMQVMPSTALWIANKLGLSRYDQQKLTNIEMNLIIGTAYLRMLYDDLNHSFPLATAAYNAGPARARIWRTTLTAPMEAAIFIETIPFYETRDYVKNVMSNMHSYYMLTQKQVPNFTQLLGTIYPNPALRTELP